MSRLIRFVRACVGTPLNAGITAGLVLLLAWALPPLVRWGLADATWSAIDRRGCGPDGACWAFIRARWALFFYGPYPVAERWRVDLAAFLLVAALLAALFVRRGRGWALFALLVGVPVVSGVLLAGGVPGLPAVTTADWGGLLLNVVLCFLAVAAAIPLGTLLALGRRARLPFVRALCTGLVEFWRGVPILAIAGSLAAKPKLPESTGTFPTHGPLFIGLLIGVIIILGGLQFMPADTLGPLAEHYLLYAGKTF